MAIDRARGGHHDFEFPDEKQIEASQGLTPSQTVGPFFAYGLTPGTYGYPLGEIHQTSLIGKEQSAETIIIEGQVFDGTGGSVHDAMIEIIQADEQGRYGAHNDGFTGFGRMGTGSKGPETDGGDTHFRFETIKPGPEALGFAASITLILTMRGLTNHCITRLYFPEDNHSTDPVLTQVPEDRRHTLIAKAVDDRRYRFDIHMQGPDETVFFDL